MNRLDRERITLGWMLETYCRAHHRGREAQDGLCAPCQDLHRYALGRLNACRWAEDKPTCRACPTHCYQPGPRAEVRKVMGYSGPRMLWAHPLLALGHLGDTLFRAPGPRTKR